MNRFRTIAIFISVVMLPAGYSFAQSPDNAGKNEPKPNSHIKTTYNRSKNETVVTLKTLPLSSSMNREVTRESEYGQLDLDLHFTYPGQFVSHERSGSSTSATCCVVKNCNSNFWWLSQKFECSCQ